jgi:hypothetical protein
VQRPLVVDGRNMFEPDDVTASGFHYLSIGRKPAFNGSEESAHDKRVIPAVVQ